MASPVTLSVTLTEMVAFCAAGVWARRDGAATRRARIKVSESRFLGMMKTPERYFNFNYGEASAAVMAFSSVSGLRSRAISLPAGEKRKMEGMARMPKEDIAPV